MRVFRLLVAAQVLAGAAWSQDTTTVPPPSPAPAAAVDSTRLIKPLPAFFHSALIPGWGQAKLDRKLTGALFMAWEGLTLGMTLKAASELRYLERIEADSARLEQKRQERQDWLVLLIFNHVFAGLEAYVSSHLQGFPSEVQIRVAPRGLGVQAVVPVRLP
ncbi:MAG TPA: hypothetical protein VI383_04370 [Gemmatimonadales bacterium]|nr:hypothetical protein [Gemmatimonadales bacterium]